MSFIQESIVFDRAHKDSKFGPGPWLYEPDSAEWYAHGLPCMLLRDGSTGVWRAYVGVYVEHALYGVNAHEADALIDKPSRPHGGITYASTCQPFNCSEKTRRVARVTADWWFGFDAAHPFDLVPSVFALLPPQNSVHAPAYTYRGMAFMQAQCETLAAQLAALAA